MAAEKAVTFIHDNSSVGLGAGSTMAYMVEFLQEKNLSGLQVYTSSADTKNLLQLAGFSVNEIYNIDSLDIYFDGCDQFDKDLNAFKSGAGIHTKEKLFASMAKQFFLVGDESKYVETLNTKYPLVVEILPDSLAFVQHSINKKFPVKSIDLRKNSTDEITVTEYGNYLLDIRFDALPELSQLNSILKNITGVLETSLFYNMANKAIVAGENGVRIIEKK